MAAGDRVQKGQQWKVEFGAFSFTGYLVKSWTYKKDADDTVVPDHRKATITHILTNPRIIMSGDLMIKDTGSITPPKKGSFISLQAPDAVAARYYYVEDAQVSFSDDITMLSLSLMIEDSQFDGASITPLAANYDLGTPADLEFTVTLNSAASIVRVSDADGNLLVSGTDFSFAAGTLTLDKDEYLADHLDEEGESVVLEVEFNLGAPVFLTITAVA